MQKNRREILTPVSKLTLMKTAYKCRQGQNYTLGVLNDSEV
jgi:hypothetical protein